MRAVLCGELGQRLTAVAQRGGRGQARNGAVQDAMAPALRAAVVGVMQADEFARAVRALAQFQLQGMAFDGAGGGIGAAFVGIELDGHRVGDAHRGQSRGGVLDPCRRQCGAAAANVGTGECVAVAVENHDAMRSHYQTLT